MTKDKCSEGDEETSFRFGDRYGDSCSSWLRIGNCFLGHIRKRTLAI